MAKHKLLIVDDDRTFVETLRMKFEGGYFVECAYSEREFYDKFIPNYFDLILLDIRLEKDKEGLQLLKYIKDEEPSLPVLMITAYPDVDSAVLALKTGARDYIQKEKVEVSALVKIVDSLIQETVHHKKVRGLEKMLSYFADPLELVGRSHLIEEVKEKLKIAAEDGEVTVLIRGDTGVGKELVARNIHAKGKRKDGPFIVHLIAGAHREIIDSELFGHEKGAFTGAVEKKKGLLEEAHGGVLFLDEIGDLPEETQIKLLRVLESKSFRRLGGNREVKVDVQFITATNKDFEELVRSGKLRLDLYYRLKNFEIFIPPLRERKEDIPLLAQHFLDLFKRKKGAEIEGITDDAMRALLSYDWPGNVRELRNVLERAIILTKRIGVKMLTPELMGFKTEKKEMDIKEISAEKAQDLLREEEIKEVSIEKWIARAELEFVKKGLERYGKRREIISQKLGYPNRFTFIRRIKRIFTRFPELKKDFPQVAKVFKIW